MRSLFRTMCPFAVAALFAAAAFGQEAPPPPDMVAQQAPEGPGGPGPGPGAPGFHHMELLGFGGVHGGKVVTGAPFMATAVTQSTHTLADGTKITNNNQIMLFRDSQGRFRKEGTMPPLGDLAESQPHSFIVIQDPVASKGYILNPDKKIAHVMENDLETRAPQSVTKIVHDSRRIQKQPLALKGIVLAKMLKLVFLNELLVVTEMLRR